MTVGRNDPCPCGSGKKYKHCCLGVKSVAKPLATARLTPEPNDFSKLPEDVMSPAYWEAMQKRLPKGMRKKVGPMIEQAKQLAEYKSRQQEIEAAARTLESHRKKYEKLTRNPKKLFQRTEKLFDEEPFADMWFSAADIQRAFDEVGYPVMSRTDAKFVESAEKAICFLADDAKRKTLARRLMLMLPDYVNAGCPLDAWIIQHSALITGEPTEGAVGPFLLAMFVHGMREWEEQRDREQLTLFKKLGINPEEIRRLGYDDVEAWVQEMMKNPDQTATLKKFLAGHQELKALMEARFRDAEDAALALLKREDACDLFLSAEEIAPWFPVMEQRIMKSPEILASVQQGQEPDESAAKAFVDLVYSMCGEMAAAVFTASRLDRLTSQLHEYRRGLSEKDLEGIGGVHGALMAVQSKNPPAENHFLVTLCWLSIHAAIPPPV